MTEKDKKLVARAESLHYSEWDLIDENKAETEEGRARLHSIKMRYYHKEEHFAGLD